jgi:hypothetical protein
MDQHSRAGLLERFLSPRPLLAGVVFSFLGCCIVGRILRSQNQYINFTRFHTYISPQTQYYPTASQVRSLARATLDPEKVAVVVGGNSILQGVGQRATQIWTKRLQELLGDDYRVINLALAGTQPAEFGGVMAEVLSADYHKLIFITDTGSSAELGGPDRGGYHCFFWDAYFKNMLRHDPEREHLLHELSMRGSGKVDHSYTELQLGRRIDALLYFQDLWTSCTLRSFGTVWVPLPSGRFTRARQAIADPNIRSLKSDHYLPAEDARSMEIVEEFARYREALSLEEYRSQIISGLKACFPAPAQKRTLVLVMSDSPAFVERLKPRLKEDYHWAITKLTEIGQAAGCESLAVGGDFAVDDFVDRCHLSEKGGRKLAQLIAPTIRGMARRLGYLKEGE